MEVSQIEPVLHLHRQAYDLLLWVNKRAESNPDMLSDRNIQNWRFPDACSRWLRSAGGTFPHSLRLEERDIPVVANLFSSFFQTSFRLNPKAPVACLDDWGEPAWEPGGRRKLVAGQPSRTKAAKAKTNRAMLELCLLALQELAAERQAEPSRSTLEAMAVSAEFSQDTLLWTWFRELNRRAYFASQGTAVHRVWQSLDKSVRERLDSTKILEARSRLLKGLLALTAKAESSPL